MSGKEIADALFNEWYQAEGATDDSLKRRIATAIDDTASANAALISALSAEVEALRAYASHSHVGIIVKSGPASDEAYRLGESLRALRAATDSARKAHQ